MLIGGNFSPYRIPAGGVPFFCATYSHASADALEPQYNISTQVPNYDTTVGGTIAPYERFDNTTDQCDPDSCAFNGNCPPVANGVPFENWIGTDLTTRTRQYTMVAGNSNSAPSSFSGPSGTINFAVCHKRGFKNVAAKRWWHGARGLLDYDGGDCDDVSLTCGGSDPCHTGSIFTYRSYQSAPSQVKYLTAEVSGEFLTIDADDPTQTQYGYTYDATLSVNAQSGEITGTVSLEVVGHPNDLLSTLTGWLTIALGCTPTFFGIFGFTPSGLNPDGVGTTGSVTSSSNTAFAASWDAFGPQTWTGAPAGVFHLQQASVSVSLSNENLASDIYADMVMLLGRWDLSDDSQYPWRVDGQTTIAPKMSRLEVQTNVTPIISGLISSPTSNDLTLPIADADGSPAFSPDWTPTYAQRAWFDPAANQWQFPAGTDQSNSAAIGLVKMFDGSIQGAPNPAGYEGYFRFDFEDWRVCCADIAQWYRYGWGASVPAFLPQNATQWTNNFEMMNKPLSGALLAYLDVNTISSPPDCAYSGNSDAAFWATKWAECGETYQSYNFARPAGRDKFLLDETQPVYCYDGTLTNVADGSAVTVVQTGTWGGASAGGFYDGFASVAGVVTFGTKLFSAPSDWNNNSNDAATAFGKLRFSSAPSLLGRVVIAPDLATGMVMTFGSLTVPAAQTNFGMAVAGTEAVDLYDASMTALASNVTATRVSDTVFTVAASYPSAVFATNHGAAAYQYCDDYPKGDFIYLEWLLDNRTNGEYNRLNGIADCSCTQVTIPTQNNGYASFSQTQDALPILKCSPRVACFSPNGEVFKNGNTYPFPESFPLDERYGCKWQAQIIWSMTDPLWQTPHMRCGLDGEKVWGIDDGSCQPDTDANAYFGKPPMFEARLAVPSGFPAMPSGIALGFLSPVLFNSGDVAFPPGLTGYDGASGFPNAVVTPWVLAIALCAALPCDQFGYAEWVVGCQPATGD